MLSETFISFSIYLYKSTHIGGIALISFCKVTRFICVQCCVFTRIFCFWQENGTTVQVFFSTSRRFWLSLRSGLWCENDVLHSMNHSFTMWACSYCHLGIFPRHQRRKKSNDGITWTLRKFRLVSWPLSLGTQPEPEQLATPGYSTAPTSLCSRHLAWWVATSSASLLTLMQPSSWTGQIWTHQTMWPSFASDSTFYAP